MSVPGTPNNTPDFINHYINQYISEQCVIELNKLSYDYLKEKQAIEKEQRDTAPNRKEYTKLTGEEANNPFPEKLKKLEVNSKQAALNIAKKEAQLNGTIAKEWKDPEPEKSVKEKSAETEKHLNEKQEAMTAKINASKERERDQEREQKPERATSKEEQKAQLIQQMREQWGMNKEKIFEPQKVDENVMNEELSREEKRAQLIEQMKQQSQELSRNKELNKDIER